MHPAWKYFDLQTQPMQMGRYDAASVDLKGYTVTLKLTMETRTGIIEGHYGTVHEAVEAIATYTYQGQRVMASAPIPHGATDRLIAHILYCLGAGVIGMCRQITD